jgi:hypothetical protein
MDLQNVLVLTAVSGGGAWLVSAWLKWLHRRYVDPLPFPNKELAGDVHQTRVITINCGPDKAILAARDAVVSLPKSKPMRMAGRKLEARVGMTWRSFGEVIVISVETADSGKSSLSIESRPRYSGTTLDQGKNYENVERIFAHLARTHAVSLLKANAERPEDK